MNRKRQMKEFLHLEESMAELEPMQQDEEDEELFEEPLRTEITAQNANAMAEFEEMMNEEEDPEPATAIDRATAIRRARDSRREIERRMAEEIDRVAKLEAP